MMKFYYGKLKTKMLTEKQITEKKQKQVTSLFLIYHSRSYCLFIIKRFAQINIFKLSDDILDVILLNKLLQGFVVCAVFFHWQDIFCLNYLDTFPSEKLWIETIFL